MHAKYITDQLEYLLNRCDLDPYICVLRADICQVKVKQLDIRCFPFLFWMQMLSSPYYMYAQARSRFDNDQWPGFPRPVFTVIQRIKFQMHLVITFFVDDNSVNANSNRWRKIGESGGPNPTHLLVISGRCWTGTKSRSLCLLATWGTCTTAVRTITSVTVLDNPKEAITFHKHFLLQSGRWTAPGNQGPLTLSR